MLIYPWHNQIWQHLVASVRNNRMPHALLFAGARGLGKYELAVELGNFLLCTQPTEKACGECVACKLLAHNSHPDLQILGTENEMIKVEQIRELTAELNVTPHQGKMRVALINHAHLMNAASANALLKTLEEPLGHVALILISERASFLPATIRSRCQNIIFYPPAKDLAKTWLEKNIDLPQQANLLLQLSENVPLQARELSCKLPERAKFLQDIFAFSCGDLALAKFIDNCQAYTWNFIFTNIISLVLDLIKLQYGVAEITNEDQKMKLQKFKIDKIQLFAYIDKLLELNKFISENINLNQQLLLENISLDWMEMVKGLC